MSPAAGPASAFLLTNQGPINAGDYSWNFHLYYTGNINYVFDTVSGNYLPQTDPLPPTGTCEFLSNTGMINYSSSSKHLRMLENVRECLET